MHDYMSLQPLIQNVQEEFLIKAERAGEYRQGKRPRDEQRCMLSLLRRCFRPQLDEMHPKTDTHSYFGMEFGEEDM